MVTYIIVFFCYFLVSSISMFSLMMCNPYDSETCNGCHITVFGVLWPVLVPIILFKNRGKLLKIIKDIVK
jgi:hypothetical protein